MQTEPTKRYRKYTNLEAFVNGQRYPLDDLPQSSHSLTGRSSATVPLRDLLPDNAAGTGIQTAYAINGIRRVAYTGLATKRAYNVAPVDRSVQATDILSKLKRSIKEGCSGTDGLLFDNTPWVTAITNVLNRAGIVESDIASIDDPSGGIMNVGAIEAICHTPDENLDTIFADLLKMNGATAYVLPASGKVKVAAISRIPPANPSLVYSNRESNAYRWNKVSHTLEGIEGIVNRMTATGGMVEDGVQVTQTWTAVGIDGRADDISCDYWQTQSQVDWASEFYGRLKCREEQVFEVTAPVDLDVLPGMACVIDAPDNGLYRTPALITEVSTRGTEMTLTCSIGPGLTDGYATGMLPTADFAVMVVAERVLVNGQPETIYDVYCDASRSFDPDGSIVSYQWSVSGANPLNTPANAAQTLIALDSLANVTVTLTVTDNATAGNTDSLTRSLDAPENEIWTRVLSTACNSDGWRILTDQDGWKSYTRAGYSCVSVPRFNEDGPLLSLWSDGKVYQWQEYHADPVHIGTLPGNAGTIIALTEAAPDYAFASHGAVLYHSTNGGTSWDTLHTFSGTITTIETGYNDPSYIRVTVGNEVYHSFSGGLSWAVVASGASGATIQAIASSGSGHLAVLTGGSSAANAVMFDEAYAVNWTGVTTPPTALDSATALLTEAGFIVGYSGTDKLYKLLWNDATGKFDASELPITPASPSALIRDGLMPDLVYGSGNPTYKVLSSALTYDLDTVQSYEIGYGALWIVRPLAPTARVFITATNIGLQDGLFVSENNAWEHISDGSGFYVTSEWITWVSNRVLYGIYLTDPTFSTQTGATLQQISGIDARNSIVRHIGNRQYIVSGHVDNATKRIGVEHGTNLALGTTQTLRSVWGNMGITHHASTINKHGRLVIRDLDTDNDDGPPSYSSADNGVISEGALNPASYVMPRAMFHGPDWRWLAENSDGTDYHRGNGEWVRVDSDGSVNTLSFTSYSDIIWAQPSCHTIDRVYVARDNKVYQCANYGNGAMQVIFDLHAQSPADPLPEGKPITDFTITSFTVTHDRQWSHDLLAVLCEAAGSGFNQRVGFVYYSSDNGVTWKKSLNISTGSNGGLGTAWITEDLL
jgi:hypothetical protein